MTRLADTLARRILVLDGAMGTMIQAAGLGAPISAASATRAATST